MTPIGSVLCILPSHDTPGKRDMSGAFLPLAQKLLAMAPRGGELVRFDPRKPMARRRGDLLGSLDALPPRSFDSVAIFCHGWLDGIQAGFTRKTVGDLAGAIVKATRGPAPVVALYCCSTGDDPEDDPLSAAGTGEGSFADRLRDSLRDRGAIGCSIWAHTTPAHATRNPYVIRFDGDALGGYPVVAPGQPLWGAWKRALRDTDLHLRAPWMTNAEIHTELAAPLAVA